MISRFESWLLALRRSVAGPWPRKRKVRWAAVIAIALLAYPALVTAALWTGLVEWVLKADDLRVVIQKPAYTIWPGRFKMKHVRISVNGTTQFILEGDDLVMNLQLHDLLRHRVHVTELAAHDVLYQMRVQVDDTKGIERRVAAYPPLHDLPGANVVRQPPADNKSGGSPWTVQVEGLDIAVKELWFFEYRYLGKGHLRGGFMVGPDVMQVNTAVQDLGPGELRFGADQLVATEFNGQITADIPRVNPKQHEDAGFMTLVSARVNLRAAVQSLANLGAYFEKLEVSRGQGPLALDLYLDKGRLGQKSHLAYQTDSVRVKGEGYGVGSDLQLDFDAAGSAERLPVVRASSKSTYVSLARGMRALTVQIHGHHEEAQLDTIQLSRATDLKQASLRMPNILAVDLKDLAVVLPEGAPVDVRKGEAQASLNLDIDHDYWAHGTLTTATKDLKLEIAKVDLAGNLKVQTQVRFNPKLATYELQNLAFTMRDLGMRAGTRTVGGWWMNLDGKRLTLKTTDPPQFDGALSIRARDLGPVLEVLAEKDVISKLIPMFTSLSDFRAGITVRAAGPVTDVTMASESDVWDAAGRIYRNGKQSKLALVVGGQAVSLGIARNEHGLELMPFAKTQWLNDQLRDFPKPIVQMSGKKP